MFTGLNDQAVQYRSLGFGEFNVSRNTLALMASAIVQSGKNPLVRDWATKMIKDVPQKDEWGEAEAIYHFVQNHSRYVKDPQGTEMLQSPLVAFDYWNRGIVWSGDCDDFSILILSLLKSIGYKVGLRAASYNPKGTLQHVYGMVELYHQWYPVDGIKEGGMIGWEKEGITNKVDFTIT